MRTGTIYKLVCNDLNAAECYVGSTDSVRNRKSDHKHNCNNVNGKLYNLRVYDYIRENGGWENWKLIELERYQYERKPELHARERYHMEQLGATLNSRVPNRTDAEYRQDNVEQIKQRLKQYYHDNSSQIKQKAKRYYQENAEQIKQQYKTKHDCPCGGKYTHINRPCHLRTQRHCLYQLGLEQNV
jgi:hypothetical protein